ncbi:MAG: hypothetical protein CL439_04790 [Acidimicrobiaceae bacterium]|nr:hypothetical protein [Acidimicrobiaceae bacterium]
MSAANDLLSNYQNVITNLSLIGGDKGIFDVEVDGTTIYSKHETGRHAESGEILAIFKELVGPETPVYGT